MKVHEAINAVMIEVGAVEKKDKNTVQNFPFRGIDSIVNAVSPMLQKHGVIIYPYVLDETHEVVKIGQNQTSMAFVRLRVSYTFMGPEGDILTSAVSAEAMDAGDKATAKAMSVAWRTVLIQVFALTTGDVDADSETFVRSGAPEARPVLQSVPPAEDDPWATVETVGHTPFCKHGARKYWQSSKSGAEFWFCPISKDDPDVCEALKV